MKVCFKKIDQNGAALTCERTDGSKTWQRPKPSQASFFILHDLTHFACEAELAELDGFFTLIANGWNIEDFETNTKTLTATGQKLPEQALIVEMIVGLIDNERASRTHWSASEFNEHLDNYCTPRTIDLNIELSDEQLQSIRARRNKLFARWRELPPGETMELEFVIA